VPLTAELVYNGLALGADMTIERATDFGTVLTDDVADLYYGSAAQTWLVNGTDGTAIPDPTAAAPINVCGGACASGAAQAHQLAVFIPDSRGAGSFTTVVTYTGTAN
jgi:hypothetical protein